MADGSHKRRTASARAQAAKIDKERMECVKQPCRAPESTPACKAGWDEATPRHATHTPQHTRALPKRTGRDADAAAATENHRRGACLLFARVHHDGQIIHRLHAGVQPSRITQQDRPRLRLTPEFVGAPCVTPTIHLRTQTTYPQAARKDGATARKRRALADAGEDRRSVLPVRQSAC